MSKTGRKRTPGLCKVDGKFITVRENCVRASKIARDKVLLPDDTVSKIHDLRNQGYSYDKIAILLKIGTGSAYRYCNKEKL
jgi:hypothetical protein